MSVHKSQRHTGDLKVLMLARKLAAYTITITGNEKSFPKRHRWQLTKRIVDVAVDALESMVRANCATLGSVARIELQRRAQADLEVLLTVVDLSGEVFSISPDRLESWCGMICDTQRTLAGWIHSDVDRSPGVRDCRLGGCGRLTPVSSTASTTSFSTDRSTTTTPAAAFRWFPLAQSDNLSEQCRCFLSRLCSRLIRGCVGCMFSYNGGSHDIQKQETGR